MKVELLESYGGDKMVVDTARVSYDKIAENYTKEQNDKLIAFLYKHGHNSPFKHPKIQFRVECPIYVERQLFKHQVGVDVNSISGRYVDFSTRFERIKEWRKQSKSSKQGSEGLVENQSQCSQIEQTIIEVTKKAYDDLIELGVSKEQARTILPLNLQTKFIGTYSLLAFINMCNQRLKKDTQKETREVVQEMYRQIKATKKFETTFSLIGKDWMTEG